MAQRTVFSAAPDSREVSKSRGHWHRETHIRHRDYSPTLGRFIERDPIGFEAGDNNWYRFVANGPTRMVDPQGLCVESCCCVNDVDLKELKRYVDTETVGVSRERWGHSFTAIASLTNKPGAGGKCKLQWFECSTSGTGWTREDKVDHTKWHDAYRLFKGKNGNAAAENWLKYEKERAPFAATVLGDFQIDAVDTPASVRTSSGERRIVIRVSSAKDCHCDKQSVTVRFTQTLVSTGRWSAFDQLNTTPRPGEEWRGDKVSGEFGDEFAKTCGPLPE